MNSQNRAAFTEKPIHKLQFVENKNKTRNNNPLIFPDSQLEALQFVLGL